MKLEFLFIPTSDLSASLALYRDGLGFTEAWREGDNTVALDLPDSDVKLMLDVADASARPGPLFVVHSVAGFRDEHPSLSYTESLEIPGGWLTSFSDAWSNVVYLMDQSTADAS